MSKRDTVELIIDMAKSRSKRDTVIFVKDKDELVTVLMCKKRS